MFLLVCYVMFMPVAALFIMCSAFDDILFDHVYVIIAEREAMAICSTLKTITNSFIY